MCFECVTATARNDFKSLVPRTGKALSDFIPKGYDTLDAGQSVARGDLNKDGLEDVVLVLKNIEQENPDNLNDDADRPLIVLFRESSGYRLASIAMNVVMCKGCGGAFGDPFVGVVIEKNILTISHYGGSAWRWSFDTKFRYQNNDFYLIGKTYDSFWINSPCETIGDGARDYYDINFLTGDRIRIKTSEDCKELLNKKDKIKIKPLIRMADSKVIDN
ncbi:hypothetical protein CAP35_10110 [Chitinophagaceae bacterium IBVUCB1]|nr:hypothetical protein CAP35_10110 [Chitinophagaceae bacterium IBVUCB1]